MHGARLMGSKEMTLFAVHVIVGARIDTDRIHVQLSLSDIKSFFSKNHAWSGGKRNGRWAIIIDKNGKIIYADVDEGPGQITVRAPSLFYISRKTDHVR